MTYRLAKISTNKLVLLLLAGIFLSIQAIAGEEFPSPQNPSRLVNDFENILGPEEESALESKLLGYQDTTSTQIAIVTIPTLNDYNEQDYANRLFEKWKIGQEGKDNGILILICKNERAAAIEVGYGMEARITDGISKRILEEVMFPQFKQGNFYKGIDESVNAIMQRASGEFKGDGSGRKKGKPSVWTTIIILMVIFFIFSRFRGPGGRNFSSRGGRGGGFIGGGFGGFGGGGFGGGGGGGFGGFGGGGSGGGGAGGRW